MVTNQTSRIGIRVCAKILVYTDKFEEPECTEEHGTRIQVKCEHQEDSDERESLDGKLATIAQSDH